MHTRALRRPAGFVSLLTLGLLLAVSGAVRTADADVLTQDEKTLKDAKVATDGPALLEFFRKRTLNDEQRKKIAALIQQLGEDDFDVREKASRELTAVGPAAEPALLQAASDNDAEIASRARQCLNAMGAKDDGQLPRVALRVLVARKPAGAVPVLLGYIPSAADESLEDEIAAALTQLGLTDGKPDAALVNAAKDPLPVRRFAAVAVLAKSAEHRAIAQKLLQDAEPRVRWQSAQALLTLHDKAAVPALVTLLGDGPLPLAWQAEDLLHRIAGEGKRPDPIDLTNEGKRRAGREAWEQWWKDNGPGIDLAKIKTEDRLLGLTLICDFDGVQGNGGGQIWECGPDGKARWKIGGLVGPADAQVLPGGRVLIAECNANKVTERDYNGKILWEKQLNSSPVSVQRLTNGNTFIATYTELMEVNRDGKPVYNHQKPNSIYCAQRQPSGNILYVNSGNQLIEIDRTGKQLRAIAAGNTSGWGSIEALPGGRFLIAQYSASEVHEIDATGKVVWKVAAQQPTWATRLKNGNTLIANTEGRGIIEVDRTGKKVWELKSHGRVFRVRRR